MASSSAVVIYSTATKLPLRVVIPDTDKQITDPKGPCQLQDGEAKLLVPRDQIGNVPDEDALVFLIAEASK